MHYLLRPEGMLLTVSALFLAWGIWGEATRDVCECGHALPLCALGLAGLAVSAWLTRR